MLQAVVGATAALAIVSCDDPLTSTGGGTASIELRVEASGAGAAALDAGRIIVVGPTAKDTMVTPGATVVIRGLMPGTYTVVLLGLVGGAVDHFGTAAGITVTAGQRSQASVTFVSFVPTVSDPQPTVVDKKFTVTWTAVTGAASYRLDAATDPGFTQNVVTINTATLTADVTVPVYARYYVRVRGINTYTMNGRPGTRQVAVPAPIFMVRLDDVVRRYDAVSGDVTDVGSLGIGYSWGECAWHPGHNALYMTDGRELNRLYRVNPATGAADLVGAHGVTDMFALEYHPPTDALYGVSVSTDNLYRFNTVTGAATLIGPTGASYISGLAWDSARNLLMGINAFTMGEVYTLNVATGAATLVASPGSTADLGMTYDPTIDRLIVADHSGNIYRYDPTASYARTSVSTGQGNISAICYAPLPDPAGPPTIALLANTSYVNYMPGTSGAEASNVEATLESFGLTVNTFTDISAAGIGAALTGARILAIPELESGDIVPALTAPARAAIVSFVETGGTLITFLPAGNNLGFLNTLFGYSMTTGGTAPYAVQAAPATGTSFQGGPASLAGPSATVGVTSTTVPAGTRQLYVGGTGAAVVVIPRGRGEIIVMGWDWFDAAPVGATDGGWLEVLERATDYHF